MHKTILHKLKAGMVHSVSGWMQYAQVKLSSSSSSSWKLLRRPLRGLSGTVQYMRVHKKLKVKC